jgi:hypothetical protein
MFLCFFETGIFSIALFVASIFTLPNHVIAPYACSNFVSLNFILDFVYFFKEIS